MSDDAKKIILARRARFVAATLAGLGVACGKEPTPPPQPCLAQPMTRADAAAPPEPCLSPMPPPDGYGGAGPSDAGIPVEADAGSKPAMTATTPPTGPVPRPCLTPVRPKDKTQR